MKSIWEHWKSFRQGRVCISLLTLFWLDKVNGSESKRQLPAPCLQTKEKVSAAQGFFSWLWHIPSSPPTQNDIPGTRQGPSKEPEHFIHKKRTGNQPPHSLQWQALSACSATKRNIERSQTFSSLNWKSSQSSDVWLRWEWWRLASTLSISHRRRKVSMKPWYERQRDEHLSIFSTGLSPWQLKDLKIVKYKFDV